MAEILGTSSSEVLTGGSGIDTIDGGGGNDIINSGAGNDIIDGGAGSDRLNGGSGNDTLIYKLSENGGFSDLYMGGSGLDTVRIELTSEEWAGGVVQQEILQYLQHLAAVKTNIKTGEVSNGAASDFTFDFGGGTMLTVSMMEKLEVVVNGELINPEAPFITSPGAVTISENTTAVTTVAAFDINSGTLTYSLVSGHGDNSLFTIDPDTGVLSFAATPNFEAPMDGGGDNIYNVRVQVSDGTLTDTQDIAVTVTDVNEAPSAGADQMVDAPENVDDTTVLATVVGGDPDVGGGNDALNNFENLSYAIQSDASGKFEIDPVTGAISLASGQALDYESEQSHTLTVRVSDGPGLYDDVAVTIDVSDVNEAPSAGADQVVDAPENVDDTTVLATVVGSDPDVGGGNDALNNFENLSYAIQSDASGKFEIDPVTGAISLASGQALDYESEQSHTLTVRVSDGPGLYDDVTVTINVTDVEENVAPVATGESIVISDNITLIPKAWLLGNDTDADGDALSLSGLPSGMTLDASGNVVVAAGLLPSAGSVFHAATTTQAAYTVYSLSYTVSDGQGGVSTPVTLTLAVVDTGGGAAKVDLNGIAADLGGSYSYSSISGQGNGDTLTGMTTTGSSAIDFLVGDGGNDILNGGTGSDTLSGSGGSDTFIFSTVLGATNVDTITDFNSGVDKIHLENTGAGLFNALTTGVLSVGALDIVGAGAEADGTTRIIYDPTTGALSYDADGTGTVSAAVQFATLGTGTHPSTVLNTDFVVI